MQSGESKKDACDEQVDTNTAEERLKLACQRLLGITNSVGPGQPSKATDTRSIAHLQKLIDKSTVRVHRADVLNISDARLHKPKKTCNEHGSIYSCFSFLT